jgi:hypothetical protein
MVGAVAIAAMAGCGQGETSPGNVRKVAIPADDAAALTGRVAIVTGSDPMALLDQCSRDAPARGESSFQPALADIAAMEDAVAVALAKRLAGGATEPAVRDIAALRRGWSGDFIGIVRQGKRFIYASYGPVDRDAVIAPRPVETTAPRLMCDGGPDYFGAEYDVAARAITHLAFNGAI